MQTYNQENLRVKINWDMVLEVFNKFKKCENKKGEKKNR